MPLPGSRVVHPRMLDEVQAVEENALPDGCTITRAATRTVDETTATSTGTPVTIYTGACRVQPDLRFARDIDHGDISIPVTRYRASLPLAATGIHVDDILTLTVSHDPALIDAAFTIRDVSADTFASRRFCDLERRPKTVPT